MEVTPDRQDEILYIRFNREFSIRNITDVEELWYDAPKTGARLVAFEFSGLEFIDSSAIGTLVKFLNERKNLELEMVILNPSPIIYKIFETAHLSKLFKIFDQAEFEKKYIVKR